MTHPGPPVETRRRALASLFIAAILVFQAALPLRYYIGDDEFDERFAWRMFSPIRVTDCTFSWFEGPDRTPIKPNDIHMVWSSLMARARTPVIDGYAQHRCRTLGGRAELRLDLTCAHPDGEVRRLYTADRNLCEGV